MAAAQSLQMSLSNPECPPVLSACFWASRIRISHYFVRTDQDTDPSINKQKSQKNLVKK